MAAPRAAASPALRARYAITVSASALPKRATRSQVLASPAALRPTSLKPALRSLFCATHSDWQRFDGIFDAYWQGRGMRQRQVLSGAPSASHAPARRLAEAHVPQEALGLPDHVERRSDGDGEAPRTAAAAAKAPRAPKL